MDKILVVFTGGTISCRTEKGVMNAVEGGTYLLLDRYRAERGQSVSFVTASPLTILSENLVPDDWRKMADCIREKLTPDMAGVILTHGTDTLAYTASILSYLLAELEVPVILVAGDRPPDDPAGNALLNFAAAVDFICREKIPGVYAIYHQAGRTEVFLGSRLTQAGIYTHRFSSVTGIPFGEMKGGELVPVLHPANPTLEELRRRPTRSLPSFPVLENLVAYIRPYPGLDYRRFSLSPSVKAVFHGLYHSGTACVRPIPGADLTAFAEECEARGVEVYVSPVWFTPGEYASTDLLREKGVRWLPPMAEEAAYTKLLLAYTLYPEDAENRRAWLEEERACEFLHPTGILRPT